MTKDKPKQGQRVVAFGEKMGTVSHIEGDRCHYTTDEGLLESFLWRSGDRSYHKYFEWYD